MNLQQIKDEVAVRRGGCKDFTDLLIDYFNGDFYTQELESYIDEAMQEYAKQVCEHQREMCAEDLPIDTSKLAISCILNTPLAV